MKFSIRKEEPVQQEKEKELEFWLDKKENENTVSLYVSEKGSTVKYCVLQISEEGLTRIRYVSKDLGFKTEGNGRIPLANED